MEKDTLGSVSEWNEGNFKNLRLHEAQELINIGKINPFDLSEDGTAWHFQVWKSGIDILYGEGQSKYGNDEIEEIDQIQELIDTLIKMKPPFRALIQQNFSGKQSKFIPLKENQNRIEKFLRLYEKKVKYYNDQHGLSTRNRDDMDDGL